jgi:hypothetical protein
VDIENGCVPRRVFDLKLICEHADANAGAVKISSRLLGCNPHWRDTLELKSELSCGYCDDMQVCKLPVMSLARPQIAQAVKALRCRLLIELPRLAYQCLLPVEQSILLRDII